MSEPSLNCWKCGAAYHLVDDRVPFRADCDSCGTGLHSCMNCQHYRPGLPNDCFIPDTDRIVDKERFNFCEEFKPYGEKRATGSADSAAKKLFGDDEEDEPPRSSIDSLFKD